MNPCIVVVDDEPDLLAMVEELLRMEGFEVVGVSRPDRLQDALAGVTPGLFLIDIMLPQQSGIELADELRKTGYSDTPMVAMSASTLMLQVARDSQVFDSVLGKPFDLVELLGTVQRAASPETA